MAPTLYDKKPECGDLIEIFRGYYQHWALYVGNGYVVHFGPACEVPDAGVSSVMSVLTNKAVVRKDELWKVVGTDRWEINNSLDKKYEPRPVSDIVKEAQALVGEELPYCLFMENCEHFVTKLRYGKAVSIQVRKAGQIAMATVAAAFVSLGIVGLGYLFGGSKIILFLGL